MGRCNKCGKPTSTRLGSLCMKCRYENKKMAPSVQKKIKPKLVRKCEQCGKEFFTANPQQKFCSNKCRKRAWTRIAYEKNPARTLPMRKCRTCGSEFKPAKKTSVYCPDCKEKQPKYMKEHKRTAHCNKCGKSFTSLSQSLHQVCPECLAAEQYRPAPPPHVDSPTRPTMARPGGWTGPIAQEEPAKPVKAKIRIPASRLPAPPFPPTKPLRINLEPPQVAYEYEVTPEAREAQKPKKIIPVMSRRKRP